MRSTKIAIYLLTVSVMLSSVSAHAFWGFGDSKQSGLNLETGYDANTVTTNTGRIVSVQAGDEHGNAQLKMDSDGVRVVVVLGPQRYWVEHGIALKVGDSLTVRGSKAQGADGVIYILAQKITDDSLNTSVSLRNESGCGAWSYGGTGTGSVRNTSHPAHMRQLTPGRMGGRMGR